MFEITEGVIKFLKIISSQDSLNMCACIYVCDQDLAELRND